MPASVHIFGIRHHGPGSARSLRRALEDLQPDLLLVEGPPDAADALPLLANAGLEPPVALLLYARDEPRRAVYFPFAQFSPEWQALQFALRSGIPARFMDLPQTHQMALTVRQEQELEERLKKNPAPASDEIPPDGETLASPVAPESAATGLDPIGAEPEGEPAGEAQRPGPDLPEVHRDPLLWLAHAAGYSDGERWWDHLVESRLDGAGLFAGIQEAMTALRSEVPGQDDEEEAHREALREAWMRRTLRAGLREGCQRIAVVCGAWHGPALELETAPTAEADEKLLAELPSLPVQATWIPWTHSRLARESGYGAGVESPGWYAHLWDHPEQASLYWLTRAAQLLREEGLDASSAHVIEAARLADSLAAVRNRPRPGLPELDEAIEAVFCFGNDLPLRLVYERLTMGEALGKVPDDVPLSLIQADLREAQRRLRLTPEAAHRDLDLDLRNGTDLQRSHLLHRLRLLDVDWGVPLQAGGRKKGTFHEQWRIQWRPELEVGLIEAGIWGNTIAEAATGRAADHASRATELTALTALLEHALLAELPRAVELLMARLQALSAATSDLAHLMEVLPPLAGLLRYGSVRQADSAAVARIVDGLVTRICVGLPSACASLNDDAAQETYPRLLSVHGAITTLDQPEQQEEWQRVLLRLADQQGGHGLIAGRACRLLLDLRALAPEEGARRLGLALSQAVDPAAAATWVEGLLRDSAQMLIHDSVLWDVLDTWVTELPDEVFPALLPLLRRTFSTFSAPERRNLGQIAKGGRATTTAVVTGAEGVSRERAERVLPTLALLLGRKD